MTADPDDPEDIASFIPGDRLAAIGRIANAWAALEFAVDQTSWQLAGVPHMVGACLTAQMFAMQPKFRALVALAELRGLSQSTINKLNQFNAKRISGLQESRNRSVHDTRMIHQESGEVKRLQITAQGPLIFGFQPEPMAEIHKTRKRIEASIRDFQILRKALLAEFRALPDRSGRQLLDMKSPSEES